MGPGGNEHAGALSLYGRGGGGQGASAVGMGVGAGAGASSFEQRGGRGRGWGEQNAGGGGGQGGSAVRTGPGAGAGAFERRGGRGRRHGRGWGEETAGDGSAGLCSGPNSGATLGTGISEPTVARASELEPEGTLSSPIDGTGMWCWSSPGCGARGAPAWWAGGSWCPSRAEAVVVRRRRVLRRLGIVASWPYPGWPGARHVLGNVGLRDEA